MTLLVGLSVGLIAVLLALILVLGIMRYCTARLGGVTGDTFGAIGELVETATFCLYALLAAVPADWYRVCHPE